MPTTSIATEAAKEEVEVLLARPEDKARPEHKARPAVKARPADKARPAVKDPLDLMDLVDLKDPLDLLDLMDLLDLLDLRTQSYKLQPNIQQRWLRGCTIVCCSSKRTQALANQVHLLLTQRAR